MPNKYTQPPRENKNAAAISNLPLKTFRLGRIKAAVWENQAEQKFYNVTFARTRPITTTTPTASVVTTCRWSPSWSIKRTRLSSSGWRNSKTNRASDRSSLRAAGPPGRSFLCFGVRKTSFLL